MGAVSCSSGVQLAMVFSRWVRLRVGQPGDAVWRAQRRLAEPVGRAQHHMRLAGQGALDDIGLRAVDNGGDVDNHADADGHPPKISAV